MAFCIRCGKELSETATFCGKCGAKVGAEQPVYKQQYQTQDSPSIGFNILSFLLPLAGLIIFIVHNDKKPKMASSCVKWTLIGFITRCILCAILYVILQIVANGLS